MKPGDAIEFTVTPHRWWHPGDWLRARRARRKLIAWAERERLCGKLREHYLLHAIIGQSQIWMDQDNEVHVRTLREWLKEEE